MKISKYFLVFFIFLSKIKADKDDNANFVCDFDVQKLQMEVSESILELHERLRKESDGENMLEKHRILAEQTIEPEKDGKDLDDSEENADDVVKKSRSNSEEDQNKSEKQENDDHHIEIKDLEETKKIINTKGLDIVNTKNRYVQDSDGYKYSLYFKCIATGSYYEKKINFEVNCSKHKDIDIYIYEKEKIVRKFKYKFSGFFPDVNKSTEREVSFPEFNYIFSNPSDFIVFEPDDDNCILRVSYDNLLSVFVIMLLFFIINL